jgi:FkbM family methyltransferase
MSLKYYLAIKNLFYILINNPVFFFKRIFLELKYLLSPVPESSVVKKINGVLFNFDFSYSNEIKRMYFGDYQPTIIEILKEYLKRGDTFIDVGANIGFFTAIAAGLVGENGQVHSFEPVKEYFQKLDVLRKNNPQYNIIANQFALGEEEKYGKIYIEGLSGIGNNTFFPVFLENGENNKAAEVSIRRLDKYIEENKIGNVKLMKIDVEGFEFPVLKGLKGYFLECEKTGAFPAIICEICPKACVIQGHRLTELFDYMKEFSYYPFEIVNTKKRINIDKIKEGQMLDVLFRHI